MSAAIQWYPGHMTKTRRMIEANMSLVDVVIELLDARLPYSSKNPDIDKLTHGKRRLILLNKADLADKDISRQWEEYYRAQGLRTLAVNSMEKKIAGRLADVVRAIMSDKIAKEKKRGRQMVNIRAMVVGIPNVGKSTLINQLSGSAPAVTGDRPGVTRGRQWIKVAKDFDLLDTPGVLWPKFEDKAVGEKLAFTGAINDTILDTITLSESLILWLVTEKPEAIPSRYKVTIDERMPPREILEAIGTARGFKMKGGGLDLGRAANTLLDEFRAGKLGAVTLEKPLTEP